MRRARGAQTSPIDEKSFGECAVEHGLRAKWRATPISSQERSGVVRFKVSAGHTANSATTRYVRGPASLSNGMPTAEMELRTAAKKREEGTAAIFALISHGTKSA